MFGIDMYMDPEGFAYLDGPERRLMIDYSQADPAKRVEIERKFNLMSWRSRPCSMEGVPCKNADLHSWSHDPRLIHCIPERLPQANEGDWTDRLQEWDAEKYTRLCQEHLKRRPFVNQPMSAIENLLRAWHDRPDLELVAVEAWACWVGGRRYRMAYHLPK